MMQRYDFPERATILDTLNSLKSDIKGTDGTMLKLNPDKLIKYIEDAKFLVTEIDAKINGLNDPVNMKKFSPADKANMAKDLGYVQNVLKTLWQSKRENRILTCIEYIDHVKKRFG